VPVRLGGIAAKPFNKLNCVGCRLMEKIQNDPRHIHMKTVHYGKLPSPTFNTFRLGYTSAVGPEVLEHPEKLRGQEAVSAFVALLSQVDAA